MWVSFAREFGDEVGGGNAGLFQDASEECGAKFAIRTFETRLLFIMLAVVGRVDEFLRSQVALEHGAIIHESIVPVADGAVGACGWMFWQGLLDEGEDVFVADFLFIFEKEVNKNGANIRLDEGVRGVPSESEDAAGGVRSDARKLDELLCGAGDFAGGDFRFCHDCLGNFFQIEGAAIVAEALPFGEDVGGGCFGQSLPIGEACNEGLESRDGSRRLRLLEHDLGDDDSIRSDVLAPRETAAMLLVVGPDGVLEFF